MFCSRDGSNSALSPVRKGNNARSINIIYNAQYTDIIYGETSNSYWQNDLWLRTASLLVELYCNETM